MVQSVQPPVGNLNESAGGRGATLADEGQTGERHRATDSSHGALNNVLLNPGVPIDDTSAHLDRANRPQFGEIPDAGLQVGLYNRDCVPIAEESQTPRRRPVPRSSRQRCSCRRIP